MDVEVTATTKTPGSHFRTPKNNWRGARPGRTGDNLPTPVTSCNP